MDVKTAAELQKYIKSSLAKASEPNPLAETSKKKFLTTHTGLAGRGQLTFSHFST
jgi:hypothetical protein